MLHVPSVVDLRYVQLVGLRTCNVGIPPKWAAVSAAAIFRLLARFVWRINNGTVRQNYRCVP